MAAPAKVDRCCNRCSSPFPNSTTGRSWACVLRSLLLSVLAFAGLLLGSVSLLQHWVGQGGWLGWLAGLLGGIGVLLLAVWLFVPVALVIATFYVGQVAAAVERRFYP